MVEKKDVVIGKVLYYINKIGCEWKVSYGVVDDLYPHIVALTLYEPVDMRLINGTPIKEFETPTRWQKLPKGWSYDTKLFDLTWAEIPEEFCGQYLITSPDDILQAIKDGMLVKVTENDHANIETEIDSQKGWRLVRKYNQKYRPSYLSLNSYDVYKTYEEAQAVVDAHEAELKRQTELSDYDWSVEQIDYVLNRWANMYTIPSTVKEVYRDWILSLDHIEDVEVRLWGKGIQWKYWKDKRWMDIQI